MAQVAMLAGFEPFGPYPVNPTAELAWKHDGAVVQGVLIKGVVMPATYLTCHHELLEQARSLGACRIVTLGLATRVPRLRIETVGRNWMDSTYPDATGLKCEGEPLYTGEAQALKVNCDLEALQCEMSQMSVPFEFSDDAEGFVCNALMYHVLHSLNVMDWRIPYIHIHTPWTDHNINDIKIPLGRVVLKWELLERAALIALTTLSLAASSRAAP